LDPVSGLFLLGVSQVVLGADKVLSELGQQLGDLLDGFEVDVGVQFSEGSDDGLEESLVGGVFLELGEDRVVSALKLSE